MATARASSTRPRRNIARRFLATYRAITVGAPAEVDAEQLAWFRQVHALRILVELAGWTAGGGTAELGHPWLLLEPVARRELGLPS